MLKRGQVYKIVVKSINDSRYCRYRTYMIFSPKEDIMRKEIERNPGNAYPCIFRINLVGEVNYDSFIGFTNWIKFIKPKEEDLEEINKAMKFLHLTYNRKLNRVEGYA